MQQQIHHAQAVGVWHQFRTTEGVMPLEGSLFLSQCVKIVGMVLDVTISCDEETRCARCRVLNHFPRLRPHQAHNTVDQRTGCEILSSTGFLVRCVLF
ncbi:hypothetical protein ZMO3_ZMOp32x026 (plasmid) [Zymomonas mobilis subsp. mobilis]|nr:hypothetical protein ZMO2_ZMOp32x026 [Zymomonas mobilis subsp. mobilis]AVZ28702.1 hypothetical protein ZMO3_ZMOp32x026 [Zymomonas mobilis subsp. mobilis]